MAAPLPDGPLAPDPATSRGEPRAPYVVLFADGAGSYGPVHAAIEAARPDVLLLELPRVRAPLEAFAIHPPEAILVDLEPPEDDGLRALALVRAQPRLRAVPLFAIAAAAQQRALAAAIRAGAEDYVVKPLAARDLGRALGRALGARARERAGELAATDAIARALPRGTVIAGRYEIAAFLGAGKTGAVYRAADLVARRDVALRVILPSLLARPEGTERFARAGAAMMRLAHPAIATVVGAGSDRASDLRFVALELVEGITLRAWIDARKRAGRIDAGETLGIVGQLFEALHYAHETTAHGDLRPENVMVLAAAGGAPRVKLLDFGLGRLAGFDPALDRRRDLEGLERIIHEMRTGELPEESWGDTGVQAAALRLETARAIRAAGDDRAGPPRLRGASAAALLALALLAPADRRTEHAAGGAAPAALAAEAAP
jgi:CheY-like chemotaxis protein